MELKESEAIKKICPFINNNCITKNCMAWEYTKTHKSPLNQTYTCKCGFTRSDRNPEYQNMGYCKKCNGYIDNLKVKLIELDDKVGKCVKLYH